MGSVYLTSMADILRAAGCSVVEYSGWTTRARSSGGYEPGRPLCVMWHHTASSTSAQNDANYMCNGSPDRPLCNIMIARDGAVWVLAAGATNTNGKGKSVGFSRGTVPADSMNSYAVGMEICNNGVGELYPQAQIDAAFKASNAINAHVGNRPDDVCTHNFYAPDRKIDPATADAVQGPWRPRSATSSGSWAVGDLQTECTRRAGTLPAPTPDEDDDMLFDGFWKRDNDDAVFAIFKNGTKFWIQNNGDLGATAALWSVRGAPSESLEVRVQADPCMFTAFGLVLGPLPADGRHRDEYGNLF